MPNEVIQFAALNSGSLANTELAVPVPILVPGGLCLRLRFIEFRLTDTPNTDRELFAGLSRTAEEPITGEGVNGIVGHTRFMAFASWGFETTGAAGLNASPLSQRHDVWDMDYRLVMQPTFMSIAVTSAANIFCIVGGVLVPCSEGQRNAIIATQGGAK